MCNNVDIEKYLKEPIGKRVRSKRLEKGFKQREVLPNNRNYMTAIENNRVLEQSDGSAKNLLSKNVVNDITKKLEISEKELIFGDDKELEALVRWIFKEISNIAYVNFYQKKESKENLTNIENKIIEITRFYGYFTKTVFSVEYGDKNGYNQKGENFVNNNQEVLEEIVDEINDIEIFKEVRKEIKREETENSDLGNKSSKLIKYINNPKLRKEYLSNNEFKNLMKKTHRVYFERALDYIWIFEKKMIVKSFAKYFISEIDGDILCSFNKINKKADEWIDNEFFNLLDQIYKTYKKDPIFSIGFELFNINSQKQLKIDKILEDEEGFKKKEIDISKRNKIDKDKEKTSDLMNEYKEKLIEDSRGVYFPNKERRDRKIFRIYRKISSELIEEQQLFLDSYKTK